MEHCFGQLKQKFRQLYHLKLKNVGDIVHFIRACAVLHNLSLDEELIIPDEMPPGELNVVINENDERENYDEDDRNGVLKRNEVMNLLRLEI